MKTNERIPFLALLALCSLIPVQGAAQSVLVEAKTTAGDEVATIRTDSMRLLVPLHLLVGGLLFPDGTFQTTAAGTGTSSNTPNTAVARDSSGGFQAGYVAVADSLRVRGEGSFLATGTYTGTADVPPPASGSGTRMMWYPEKAAFRAGYVDGTQWDPADIGNYSNALGVNTTASGNYSNALGSATTASGGGATALGVHTTASGDYSVALGSYTVASGGFSTALGSFTTASGYASTALGATTTASGTYSASLGARTTAGGYASTAMGYLTSASGNESTALGWSTTASGRASTALSFNTTAQAYASLAIGRYNVIAGDSTGWYSTDPLVVAGNGSNDAYRSNALTLYKNGNLTIAGTLTQSSDARLKEAIEPLEGTLDRVLQLTPIRYRFRPDTGHPDGTQIGLTAQQVQPLFPELVKEESDGYLSLSYANLSAVLVKAVQEQEAKIGALEARNQELESELAVLQASRSEILRRLRALEGNGGR